ncbi:MAG: site-2 protease family protein [Anaerolineaceae bacterium]
MDSIDLFDQVDAQVRRVFRIDDITAGTMQQGYVRRYRGHLLSDDSIVAYDQLTAALSPFHFTPLFRKDNATQLVLLIPEAPALKPTRNWINLLMFVLTVLSVIISGGLFNPETVLTNDPWQVIMAILQNGWPFAVSLVAILGIHELGHYFAGRAHGVKVTLPFFIPLPFSQLGTMGAFISMRSAPKNKRALMDIGAAGPLAGFVTSLVVLWIGLSSSTLSKIPLVLPAGQTLQMEGNSIIYMLFKYLHFGLLLPQSEALSGSALWLHWLQYFFTGTPSPLGSLDVTISPVAWAGWVGLLVTSLNLIPAGQLDGGHIFHLLFGQKNAKRFLPVILVILGLLGFGWSGWWFWAFLVFFFGRSYAEPMDQITELDGKRRLLGFIALGVFLLTFSPIPLMLIK